MADFIGEDLSGSRFERVNLAGSRFERINLSGAEFRASDIVDTRFRGVEMSGVVMRGVALFDVEIYGEVRGAAIPATEGTDLPGATRVRGVRHSEPVGRRFGQGARRAGL